MKCIQLCVNEDLNTLGCTVIQGEVCCGFTKDKFIIQLLKTILTEHSSGPGNMLNCLGGMRRSLIAKSKKWDFILQTMEIVFQDKKEQDQSFFLFFLSDYVTVDWTISPGEDLDIGDQKCHQH